jgi:serine/threonine protein kinase HipA of HipAB toxin-antitoxin module
VARLKAEYEAAVAAQQALIKEAIAKTAAADEALSEHERRSGFTVRHYLAPSSGGRVKVG